MYLPLESSPVCAVGGAFLGLGREPGEETQRRFKDPGDCLCLPWHDSATRPPFPRRSRWQVSLPLHSHLSNSGCVPGTAPERPPALWGAQAGSR